MTSWHDEDDVLNTRLNIGLWRRVAGHAWPHRRSLGALALAGLIVAVCYVISSSPSKTFSATCRNTLVAQPRVLDRDSIGA